MGGPVAGGEPGPGGGLLAAEGEGPQVLLVKHGVPDTWGRWSGGGHGEYFNAQDLIKISIWLTAANLSSPVLSTFWFVRHGHHERCVARGGVCGGDQDRGQHQCGAQLHLSCHDAALAAGGDTVPGPGSGPR